MVNFFVFTFLFGLTGVYATDYYSTVLKTVLPTPRFDTNAYYDGGEFIYITGGKKTVGYSDVEYTNEVLRFNVFTEQIDIVSKVDASKLVGCVYVEIEQSERIYCFDAGDSLDESDLFVYRWNLEEPEFENIGPFIKYGGVEYFDLVSNGENVWLFSKIGHIAQFNISDEQTLSTFDRLDVDSKSTVWVDDKIYYFSDFQTNYTVYQYTPFSGQGQGTIELPTQLPYGTSGASLLNINDTIYLLSGFPNALAPSKALKTFEPLNKFEYSEYTVSKFEDRIGSSSAYVPQLNKIYIFGGEKYDKDVDGRFVTLDTINSIDLSGNIPDPENNSSSLKLLNKFLLGFILGRFGLLLLPITNLGLLN